MDFFPRDDVIRRLVVFGNTTTQLFPEVTDKRNRLRRRGIMIPEIMKQA